MKKCLIVAALALFSVAGMQAQIVSSRSVNVKTTEVKKPKTTTWMVRGGMNVGKFVGDGADDTDSKIGYDVAFSFQKPIKDAGLFWGMEFALGTRGYSIKEDGGYGEGEDFKQMSHAFRWSPFTLGYRYDINDKFAVDAHLGAFVSVDYAGKIKWGDDDLSIGDWDQWYEDDWNRFDAGMALGFGVWYDRFNLDFTWQRGFVDAISDWDVYSSNLMLRLGVAF